MLRAQTGTVYGDEFGAAYHEAECASASAIQQDPEFDEPPFRGGLTSGAQ